MWLVLDGLTPRHGSLLTRLWLVLGDRGLGIGAAGAFVLLLLALRVASARRLSRRLARAREGVDLFSGTAWREGRSVRFEGQAGESLELDVARARCIGLGRFPSSPSGADLVVLGRLVELDAGAYRATRRFDTRDRLVALHGGRERATALVAEILAYRCLAVVWTAFALGLACLMVHVQV